MDDKEELKEEEAQKIIKNIKNLNKMRGVKSFLATFFGGIILFGTPAVVLMILDHQNIIDLSGRQDAAFVTLITSLEPQLTRWSLWITAVWAMYVILQYIVYYLPKIIIWMLIATFGFCSEAIRMAIEYIPALKNWIVWAIWQVLATASFRIFFIQLGLVSEWQMTYNCLWSATIFAEIFLLQRVFVQKLAFNFHKYYFANSEFLMQIESQYQRERCGCSKN
jgi:hypothetical protein